MFSLWKQGLPFYSRYAPLLYSILQSALLLAVRLKWGYDFFATGRGKLANHEQVTGFFTSLGIPLPGLNAWFVGGVEMVGGLLLLVGLATRPVAALLAGNMLVAYWAVEEDRSALLGLLGNSDAFVAASPFLFLFAALLCLSFGAGRVSLDALVFSRWETTTKLDVQAMRAA